MYWLDIRRARIAIPVDVLDRSFTTIRLCNMKVQNPTASLIWVYRSQGLRPILMVKFPEPVEISFGVVDYELGGYTIAQVQVVNFLIGHRELIRECSVVTIEDGTGTRTGAGRRELLCFKLEEPMVTDMLTISWLSNIPIPGVVLNECAAQLVSAH